MIIITYLWWAPHFLSPGGSLVVDGEPSGSGGAVMLIVSCSMKAKVEMDPLLSL